MDEGFLLATKRLHITAFLPSDAPFILELLNTPTWHKFIGDRHIKTLDDAKNYIIKGPILSYKLHHFGLWKVSLHNGTPIGMCGLVKRTSLNDIDIGFAFLPEFEKKGYATEATQAVLEFAKTKIKLSRIVAITYSNNVNSIRLLEKSGFTFESWVRIDAQSPELMLFAKVL